MEDSVEWAGKRGTKGETDSQKTFDKQTKKGALHTQSSLRRRLPTLPHFTAVPSA